MFGLGKKKELVADQALYAPFSGEIIPLEEVADPVFAEKVMGDGFAIEPASETIVSPVAGTVSIMQGHAIGFVRADGLEILLHLGIDTVSLNGAPFKWKVKVGDIVGAGDTLGKVDWAQVKAAGLPATTMLLITNTADALADLQVNFAAGVEAGEKVGTAIAKA